MDYSFTVGIDNTTLLPVKTVELCRRSKLNELIIGELSGVTVCTGDNFSELGLSGCFGQNLGLHSVTLVFIMQRIHQLVRPDNWSGRLTYYYYFQYPAAEPYFLLFHVGLILLFKSLIYMLAPRAFTKKLIITTIMINKSKVKYQWMLSTK